MRALRFVIVLCVGCRQLLGIDENAVLACPEMYEPNGSGSMYRFIDERVPWGDAAGRCASHSPSDHQTHLVVLSGDDELESVRAMAAAPIWVGLTSRRTEGTFLWVTDELAAQTYMPWAPTQPNNLGVACAAVNDDVVPDGLLYDRECENFQFVFLCECDRFTDDPSRYSPP